MPCVPPGTAPADDSLTRARSRTKLATQNSRHPLAPRTWLDVHPRNVPGYRPTENGSDDRRHLQRVLGRRRKKQHERHTTAHQGAANASRDYDRPPGHVGEAAELKLLRRDERDQTRNGETRDLLGHV